MNVYRSALSACVVKGMLNVHEYIHKNREASKIDKSKPQQSHRSPA